MLDLPVSIFDELEAVANETLLRKGFVIANRARSTDYGSHRSEFARDVERIILVYDGRDNALMLSYTRDSTKAKPEVTTLAEMSLNHKFSGQARGFATPLRDALEHAG